MGLETALVLPAFQNGKPVVPDDLAEHLHILAAIVFATCCGLGFERSDRRFHRWRHDTARNIKGPPVPNVVRTAPVSRQRLVFDENARER